MLFYIRLSSWERTTKKHILTPLEYIFIPTSVSDADVFATKKYISSLIELFDSDTENSPKKSPLAVILPSMIDHRDELNELRSVLQECQFTLVNHFATHQTSDEPLERNVMTTM